MEDHLKTFGDSYFCPSNFKHFKKNPQIIKNPLKISGINLIFLLINGGMGNVRGAYYSIISVSISSPTFQQLYFLNPVLCS